MADQRPVDDRSHRQVVVGGDGASSRQRRRGHETVPHPRTKAPDTAPTTPAWTFTERLATWARERPGHPALTVVSTSGSSEQLTFAGLHRSVRRAASRLAEAGIGPGDLVGVALPNSALHVIVSYAVWSRGAAVLPLRHDLPAREQQRMCAVAQPALIVSDWTDPPARSLPRHVFSGPDTPSSGEAIADDEGATPYPLLIGTGGSTGLPKLVRLPIPRRLGPGQGFGVLGELLELARPLRHLICGPLYHGNPFAMTMVGLFEGHSIVLLERFDADLALQTIASFGIEFCTLVPTMMSRMAAAPAVHDTNLSSLRLILHTAAPCPPQTKRAWIDLIGAERVWEAFGSSESVGYLVIRGDDWLTHPGSIGQPYCTDVRILDDHGRELPVGQVGELYMRLHGQSGPAYSYVGAPPAQTTADGFVSVGDLGWVDRDGWYYSADRRLDLIISGGANIVPAEVEAALLEHPAVADAIVLGLPHPDWGQQVHALVVPHATSAFSVQELDRHCRQALAAYKVPKSYEVLDALPRTSMGKINRSALLTDRLGRTDR